MGESGIAMQEAPDVWAEEMGESPKEVEVAKGPTRFTVRYVPIEEGAEVQLGDSGLPNIAGAHKLMGYQPAPPNPRARSPYEPHGWLVVLVNERQSFALSAAVTRNNDEHHIT